MGGVAALSRADHAISFRQRRKWTLEAPHLAAEGGCVRSERDFVSALPTDAMREAFAFWAARRSDGLPPTREVLRAETMPRVLPLLQLHRRTGDGRFLCRLSGTRAVAELGRETTGLHLDEVLSPEAYALRRPLFDRVLATGRPLAYRGHLLPSARDWRIYWRLLLPLRSGDMADLVLSVLAFPEGSSRETPADIRAIVETVELGD